MSKLSIKNQSPSLLLKPVKLLNSSVINMVFRGPGRDNFGFKQENVWQITVSGGA